MTSCTNFVRFLSIRSSHSILNNVSIISLFGIGCVVANNLVPLWALECAVGSHKWVLFNIGCIVACY